jgi:hypothetical protein
MDASMIADVTDRKKQAVAVLWGLIVLVLLLAVAIRIFT